MVDTPALGAGGRKLLEVQVLSPAPRFVSLRSATQWHAPFSMARTCVSRTHEACPNHSPPEADDVGQSGIPMFHHHILTKSAAVILISLAAALVFSLLVTQLTQTRLLDLDASIMTQVYALRTPALTEAMLAVSVLGGIGLITLLTLGVIAFWLANYRHLAILFVAGSLGGELLNLLLKQVIGRPRPVLSPLLDEPLASFPSGHSMDSLIVYVLLAYCVVRLTKNLVWRLLTIVIATVLVGAIGFSRIYLGVHFPSDVLGGYLAALWWLGTVWLIDHWYIRPALKKALHP